MFNRVITAERLDLIALIEHLVLHFRLVIFGCDFAVGLTIV
jgi:hypothetical protein